MASNLKLIQKATADVIDLPATPASPRQRFVENVKNALDNGTLVSLNNGKKGMRAVVRTKPTKTTIARYDAKFGVPEAHLYDTSKLSDDRVEAFVQHKVLQGMQLQDACAIVNRSPASLPTKKQMLQGKAK
jgi:hypothetical protein